MIRRASVLIAVLLFCDTAAAQPEDRRAAAQALFEQGKKLVEAGKFKEACPKLADSQRLDPGIGTSLWLADCYENAGQTASAWAQFKEAAAAAAMAKDPREKVARQRAADLEKKLARLTINIAPENKAVVVKRDGIFVGASELGNPLPVDPGTHEIVASATGYKTWKKFIDVPPQSTNTSITIPVLEPDTASSPSTPPVTAPPAGPPTTGPEPAKREEGESDGSTQRVIGVVVGGIGIVGVGVGTFFAFDAKSTYDKSNKDGRCTNNECYPEGTQLRHDAESKATIATIAIGVGAAAIVAGAVLFFTAPRAKSVAIAPSGVVVRF
jgi:hypothetical protein